MWVSREKWNALNERIEKLEKDLKERTEIVPSDGKSWRRWNPFGGGFCPPLPAAESVKDVVQRILKHLGMELYRVEGTETTTILRKEPEVVSHSSVWVAADIQTTKTKTKRSKRA